VYTCINTYHIHTYSLDPAPDPALSLCVSFSTPPNTQQQKKITGHGPDQGA
jgi:hypothetical protein